MFDNLFKEVMIFIDEILQDRENYVKDEKVVKNPKKNVWLNQTKKQKKNMIAGDKYLFKNI